MKCQECGERQATVHFTKIINGQKSEVHLCESCAREKGDSWGSGMPPNFSINQLLSGLLNFDTSTIKQSEPEVARCKTCGLSLAQFNQVGRFGCPDCYDSFRPKLEPLLRRIHGSSTHRGKVPVRSGARILRRKEITDLKSQLTQAVSNENFERAAQLRDQIRMLENQLDG